MRGVTFLVLGAPNSPTPLFDVHRWSPPRKSKKSRDRDALRDELGCTAGGFRYVGARKWGWGVHAAAEQRLSLPDFGLLLGDPFPLQHRTRGGGESSGGFPGADR